MKIDINSFYDTFDETHTKFGIDWFYFNSNEKYIEKHNKYRKKVGFPLILDEGSYFRFQINFSRQYFVFHVTIRERRIENENNTSIS